MSSPNTLLGERVTGSPDEERGGDDAQLVRKLVAGGMLRRRRLRRLLLAHLLHERRGEEDEEVSGEEARRQRVCGQADRRLRRAPFRHLHYRSLALSVKVQDSSYLLTR